MAPRRIYLLEEAFDPSDPAVADSLKQYLATFLSGMWFIFGTD